MMPKLRYLINFLRTHPTTGACGGSWGRLARGGGHAREGCKTAGLRRVARVARPPPTRPARPSKFNFSSHLRSPVVTRRVLSPY